jgi:hypothetical protein
MRRNYISSLSLESIPNLGNLNSLNLNFQENSIKDISGFISNLNELTELALNLNNNQISDLSALKNIGSCTNI